MTFEFLILNILVVVVIGIISGLIPAFMISKFKPIEVVKGAFVFKSKMVFSKIFITIQNIITIMLITCTLIMFLQIRYMLNADLGTHTENIINIDNNLFNISQSKTFKNELLKLACVEDVALCQGYPLQGGNNNTGKFDDKVMSFQVFNGDSAYFKMLGFEIIQDNLIAEWGIWLNETAMRELEFSYETPMLDFWGEKKIAGIVKDFRYRGFENIGPVMLYYNNFNHENAWAWSFLVKTTGDSKVALNEVKTVFENLSNGDVFAGQYLDDILQEKCKSEKTLSTILAVFTIMAIVISSLGLYAMAIYFIRQRKGEIAVRKVFGSSSNKVMAKLLRSYLIFVVIAFFIALPIIWKLMSKWLSDYPIRLTLNIWIFLVGGLSALLIAFFIVFYESLRAAHANPVESIRK
jgi:putative ABC transport system permease protein